MPILILMPYSYSYAYSYSTWPISRPYNIPHPRSAATAAAAAQQQTLFSLLCSLFFFSPLSLVLSRKESLLTFVGTFSAVFE